MKKFICTLAAAVALFGVYADGDTYQNHLYATGAGCDIVTVETGKPLTNATAFAVKPGHVLCPISFEVMGATKTGTTTETVFVPTNYLITATFAETNYVRTVTNGVIVSTPVEHITTVTNTVLTLNGIDTSVWTAFATNGYERTDTVLSSIPATGNVTVKNGASAYSALTLTNGTCAATGVWDFGNLVYPGGLSLSATDAEKVVLRVKYVFFEK